LIFGSKVVSFLHQNDSEGVFAGESYIGEAESLILPHFFFLVPDALRRKNLANQG
jgi:hypothetical protein